MLAGAKTKQPALLQGAEGSFSELVRDGSGEDSCQAMRTKLAFWEILEELDVQGKVESLVQQEGKWRATVRQSLTGFARDAKELRFYPLVNRAMRICAGTHALV